MGLAVLKACSPTIRFRGTACARRLGAQRLRALRASANAPRSVRSRSGSEDPVAHAYHECSWIAPGLIAIPRSRFPSGACTPALRPARAQPQTAENRPAPSVCWSIRCPHRAACDSGRGTGSLWPARDSNSLNLPTYKAICRRYTTAPVKINPGNSFESGLHGITPLHREQ